MAEGEELRQIHLRSICSSLITTDAITTKTSFQIVLLYVQPWHKKALGCNEFKETVRLNTYGFF